MQYMYFMPKFIKLMDNTLTINKDQIIMVKYKTNRQGAEYATIYLDSVDEKGAPLFASVKEKDVKKLRHALK